MFSFYFLSVYFTFTCIRYPLCKISYFLFNVTKYDPRIRNESKVSIIYTVKEDRYFKSFTKFNTIYGNIKWPSLKLSTIPKSIPYLPKRQKTKYYRDLKTHFWNESCFSVRNCRNRFWVSFTIYSSHSMPTNLEALPRHSILM